MLHSLSYGEGWGGVVRKHFCCPKPSKGMLITVISEFHIIKLQPVKVEESK